MEKRSTDPLFGDVPARELLDSAPLVRVLGQARFSKIVKISEESYIGDFQESIRNEYPHFQGDQLQSVALNVSGSTMEHKTTNTVVWRFFDTSKAIRVSLSTDSITLETAKYISRDEFLKRFLGILSALENTIRPSLVQRVGYRYVNRLQGEENLNVLSELIQPELLSVLQPNLINHFDISMTEQSAQSKEGKLISRYGLAPPNYSHDPDNAPPVSERSWVLDIDSISTKCAGNKFSSDALVGELDKVAARAYAFFRWSVTNQFLVKFGAKNNED